MPRGQFALRGGSSPAQSLRGEVRSWKTGARSITWDSFNHPALSLQWEVTTPSRGRATNNSGVSSHTICSVQPARARQASSATHVSVGTTCKLGSIFTPGPTQRNPPKCYSLVNSYFHPLGCREDIVLVLQTCKRTISLFFLSNEKRKWFCLRAARLSSPRMNAGADLRDLVSSGLNPCVCIIA